MMQTFICVEFNCNHEEVKMEEIKVGGKKATSRCLGSEGVNSCYLSMCCVDSSSWIPLPSQPQQSQGLSTLC